MNKKLKKSNCLSGFNSHKECGGKEKAAKRMKKYAEAACDTANKTICAKSKWYGIFSRSVADMSSPVVVSAFFFAFACPRIMPDDPIKALKVFFICLVTQSILPILYLLIAYKTGFIPDVHLYKKEDRNRDPCPLLKQPPASETARRCSIMREVETESPFSIHG